MSDPIGSADFPLREIEAAGEHLDLLQRHIETVCAHDGDLREREWLREMWAGIEQARAQLLSAIEQGDAGGREHGDRRYVAVPALIEFNERLRDQVHAARIYEDLGREIDETDGRSDVRAALVDLYRQLGEGGRIEFGINETAKSLSNDYEGADPMVNPPRTSGGQSVEEPQSARGSGRSEFGDPPIDFKRLAFEMVSLNARNGAAAAVAAAPRRGNVADRIGVVAAAMGMPGGVTLLSGSVERQREARSQVVEALQRNFVAIDHDGIRSYRRLDRPITMTASPGGHPIQRGRGLFVTATLKSYLDVAWQMLDELKLAAPTWLLSSENSLRLANRFLSIRTELLARSADSMSTLTDEGEGAFRRLLLVIADWLEGGGVARCKKVRQAASNADFGELVAMLKDGSIKPDERPGPVALQELDARITALGEVIVAMAKLIGRGDADDTGREAARAQAAIRAMGISAAEVIATLDECRTSIEEQLLPMGTKAVSPARVAQWAMRIADTFGETEQPVASLRRDELLVLRLDLEKLQAQAKTFSGTIVASTPLHLMGAWGQIEELVQHIDTAWRGVGELIAYRDR